MEQMDGYREKRNGCKEQAGGYLPGGGGYREEEDNGYRDEGD